VRRATTVGCIGAILTLAPATADAATVEGEHAEATLAGSKFRATAIRFDAQPGETNTVTLARLGGDVIVRDETADLVASGQCSAIDARSARCAVLPGGTLDSGFHLGDLDDSLHASDGTGGPRVGGGDGRDSIAVEGSYASLNGGPGDDDLSGGPAGSPAPAGGQRIYGGPGADRLAAGRGSDHLDGGEDDDTLDAGAGDDHLIGGEGADSLTGGDGADTASWEDHAAAVTVDLTDAGPDGPATARDTLAGIEHAVGGQGSDVLRGNGGANVLTGGPGGDELIGGAGGDTIAGGPGGDLIEAGGGDDTIEDLQGINRIGGGEGDDTVLIAEGRLVPRSRLACDGGRDELRGVPWRMLIPPDCEVVAVVGGNELSPVRTGSTRYASLDYVANRFDSGNDCGIVRLGSPAGRLGRGAFRLRGSNRLRVRVPLTAKGRRALAARQPVVVRVRLHLNACGARGRHPDQVAEYRAAF
jgi:hypothetical protein